MTKLRITDTMRERFKRFNSEKKLIGVDERILLAVSGGIDSMVMADLLIREGSDCGVAHCNFGLRGKESDADEKFVKEYAASAGIPFHSKRFETEKYAIENGLSIQMAARELRYSWFEEVMERHSYQKTAVGHNMNDNAETMLINLVRGSGIRGLSGMSPANGRIIRPILLFTRDEISDYCRTHAIKYREDRSNSEVKYTRNKIRHKVIPVLREINPALLDTLVNTGEIMKGSLQIIEEACSEIKKSCIQGSGSIFIADIKELRKYSTNQAIIYELFRDFGIKGRETRDVIDLIDGTTGSILLTPEYRLVKNRDQLLITPLKDSLNHWECKIQTPGDLLNSGFFREAVVVTDTEAYAIPHHKSSASLDFDKVVFPVTLRSWSSGDYFYPFGMRGRKKISDFFTDMKYSLPEKEKSVIMESDGKIVWLVGQRIDNRFRVTDKTRRILYLEVSEDAAPCLPGSDRQL